MGGSEVPSSTFFHLPEEKRQKLLAAARHEFARTSYADASSNRMIREAGIPRGSFYMYFTDKEELFRYLTEEYAQRLVGLMERFLKEKKGDLFAAFERLFDFTLDCCREPEADETIGNLMDILQRNAGVRHDALLPGLRPEELLRGFLAAVDTARLSLRVPEDLPDMVHILMGVTGPLLCTAIQEEDPGPVRIRYYHLLDILRRGMAKEPCTG